MTLPYWQADLPGFESEPEERARSFFWGASARPVDGASARPVDEMLASAFVAWSNAECEVPPLVAAVLEAVEFMDHKSMVPPIERLTETTPSPTAYCLLGETLRYENSIESKRGDSTRTLDRANDAFRSAIKLAPNRSHYPYVLLGEGLLLAGRTKEAEEIASRAIRLWPTDPSHIFSPPPFIPGYTQRCT